MAVGDIEKSAKFYVEAIGFREVPGFDVPASMGVDSGLTDAGAFGVRVLVLGEGPGATKLKLIQFRNAPGAKPDNTFIHSTLGFRYLTIHVSDTRAAMERLARAGVKPLAKGPVPLPEGFPKGVFLTCLKDPDGNMVELVGPSR
jgi:catechol 2,3-dioxygenase-like lactoylglutathione lyase family enzyme